MRNAPFYRQLGYSSSIEGIRKILENRFVLFVLLIIILTVICLILRIGLYGDSIRIEKVIFTGKEGKSKEGCPIAKCILRRSGQKEQLLALVRKREGHHCDATYIIVAIVVWDAIDNYFADKLYDTIVYKVNNFGIKTERRCGQNET